MDMEDRKRAMKFCPSGNEHRWIDRDGFRVSEYEPSLESGAQLCMECKLLRFVTREVKPNHSES